MPDLVISDTSSLVLFEKIGELGLLQKVYQTIFITPEIAEEFGESLPEWIILKSVSDKKYQSFLETQIDPGEASALALAFEIENSFLLLDDLKARKLALKLNLKFTGALGVIHKAKKLKVINQVKPLIDKILKTNFRISDQIIQELLRLNDELE